MHEGERGPQNLNPSSGFQCARGTHLREQLLVPLGADLGQALVRLGDEAVAEGTEAQEDHGAVEEDLHLVLQIRDLLGDVRHEVQVARLNHRTQEKHRQEKQGGRVKVLGRSFPLNALRPRPTSKNRSWSAWWLIWHSMATIF